MSYPSVADVAGELGDNSIQSGTGHNGVHYNIFTKDGQRWMTVEDGGGWERIDATVLRKCFGYGKKRGEKKVGLHEHNCGLKHSIAYLDPENTRWVLQIRQNGIIWELRAPYSHSMTLKKVSSYEGILTSPNSTYIRVPLHDPQFKTLYHRKVNSQKPNDEMLIERLRLYLSTMWMMKPEIIEKKTPIFLNGVQIDPHNFMLEDGVEIKKFDKTMVCLLEGKAPITLEVMEVRLHSTYRKDHPMFKRTIEHAGAYIFKNGRFIKGQIFPEIYGKVRDGHYSGWNLLVNMSGDSEGLPDTYTTKNDFINQDLKIQALYDILQRFQPVSGKMEKTDTNVCERELMGKFFKLRSKIYKSPIEKNHYEIKEEYTPELSQEDVKITHKARIDMIEIDHRDKIVTIWEGKKCHPTISELRQLSVYDRNIRYFSEFKTYTIVSKFIVVIDAVSAHNQKEYLDELSMIQSAYPHFAPTIDRFEDYNIGPN
jgi:hypothetical protein